MDRPFPLRRVLLAAAATALTATVQSIAGHFPGFIEARYSSGIYGTLANLMTRLTGWFPFSLAELLLVLAIVAIVLRAGWAIASCLRKRRAWGNALAHGVAHVVVATSALYAVGVGLWALNYHRLPFARAAGLDASPASVVELADLCEELIEDTNRLRAQVGEGERGRMRLEDSRWQALRRAPLGFGPLSRRYPSLTRRRVPRAKGVVFSSVLSLLGPSGIYSPYTGEPNVNMQIPDADIPITACHEIAHQLGFAREDEANFVGYLAGRLHPDVDFRYGVTQEALGYALSALFREDPATAGELYSQVDPGVVRDWEASREFWSRYDTPIREASTRVNDVYLKSQGQRAGVLSYGLMVDLLIAERREERLASPTGFEPVSPP